ncbi:MAG: hypothetical protein QM775_06995 [Pirellulales bacterium]
MKKTISLLALGLFLGSLSGCRMCCPSYDYVGPTDPGTCNNEWCGNERRGSIFSGYSGGMPTGEEVIVEDAVAPQGVAPQAAPQAPAVPKPAAPQAQPMSYGDGTQARSASARRAR